MGSKEGFLPASKSCRVDIEAKKEGWPCPTWAIPSFACVVYGALKLQHGSYLDHAQDRRCSKEGGNR